MPFYQIVRVTLMTEGAGPDCPPDPVRLEDLDMETLAALLHHSNYRRHHRDTDQNSTDSSPPPRVSAKLVYLSPLGPNISRKLMLPIPPTRAI